MAEREQFRSRSSCKAIKCRGQSLAGEAYGQYLGLDQFLVHEAAAPHLGLVQAAPTSATNVALLCQGNPGISQATKTVYQSADTGRTDASAGTTGALGIDADLAASASGSLLVAAWANGSWMYLNNSHKTIWTTVLALGDNGAGFRDLTFSSTKIAWVVYGPVSFSPADFGKLYVTRDGGQHWQLVAP